MKHKSQWLCQHAATPVSASGNLSSVQCSRYSGCGAPDHHPHKQMLPMTNSVNIMQHQTRHRTIVWYQIRNKSSSKVNAKGYYSWMIMKVSRLQLICGWQAISCTRFNGLDLACGAALVGFSWFDRWISVRIEGGTRSEQWLVWILDDL